MIHLCIHFKIFQVLELVIILQVTEKSHYSEDLSASKFENGISMTEQHQPPENIKSNISESLSASYFSEELGATKFEDSIQLTEQQQPPQQIFESHEKSESSKNNKIAKPKKTKKEITKLVSSSKNKRKYNRAVTNKYNTLKPVNKEKNFKFKNKPQQKGIKKLTVSLKFSSKPQTQNNKASFVNCSGK